MKWMRDFEWINYHLRAGAYIGIKDWLRLYKAIASFRRANET